MFNCVVCEKSLTGGLDTFGTIAEPLCEEHRYAIEDQDAENEIERLLKEIASLEAELDDIEEEAEFARGQLRAKEHELYKVEKSLERNDKPVAMW